MAGIVENLKRCTGDQSLVPPAVLDRDEPIVVPPKQQHRLAYAVQVFRQPRVVQVRFPGDPGRSLARRI